MAEATVVSYVQTADSTTEVAHIKADDGDIFTSRKFNTLLACSLTGLSGTASSGSVAVSFSGTTATIHESGATGYDYTIQLWGE